MFKDSVDQHRDRYGRQHVHGNVASAPPKPNVHIVVVHKVHQQGIQDQHDRHRQRGRRQQFGQADKHNVRKEPHQGFGRGTHRGSGGVGRHHGTGQGTPGKQGVRDQQIQQATNGVKPPIAFPELKQILNRKRGRGRFVRVAADAVVVSA